MPPVSEVSFSTLLVPACQITRFVTLLFEGLSALTSIVISRETKVVMEVEVSRHPLTKTRNVILKFVHYTVF